MTTEEFNAWCARYNLKSEQAAKVLGTSRSNGFKYANGSRPVSRSVAFGAEVIDLLNITDKDKCLKLIQERLA